VTHPLVVTAASQRKVTASSGPKALAGMFGPNPRANSDTWRSAPTQPNGRRSVSHDIIQT